MFDVRGLELVDLLHPDARLERGEEISHQLAEVDAHRGVVVDGDLMAVELVLHIHYGHRQAIGVDGEVLTCL